MPYPPLPSGYDRLPFDYRKFIEAEAVPIVRPSSGKTEVVKINGLHGDHDLEWSGAPDGAELSLPFHVAAPGTYQLMVLIARQTNGGLGRFFIDGRPVSANISFYEDGYDMQHRNSAEHGDLDVGRSQADTPLHRLKPTEAKEGRRFALDGFIVQPARRGEPGYLAR